MPSRAALRPLAIGTFAGIVAGTLDLVYASTFWGIQLGLTPLQILQSVAAGWLSARRLLATSPLQVLRAVA